MESKVVLTLINHLKKKVCMAHQANKVNMVLVQGLMYMDHHKNKALVFLGSKTHMEDLEIRDCMDQLDSETLAYLEIKIFMVLLVNKNHKIEKTYLVKQFQPKPHMILQTSNKITDFKVRVKQ